MRWQILTKLHPQTQNERRREIIINLLRNRGLRTKTQIQEFLKPPKPDTIPIQAVGINQQELSKAIARIKKAITANEAIVVYGDYDADGICATAILWEALFAAGANVLPFIPHRETHGYGLSIKGIDTIIKNPSLNTLRSTPTLIITVDNGIVAHKGVDYAHRKGIDVVICDHHEKAKRRPKALAIVHTTLLAGSGVGWMFAREIVRKLTPKLRHRSSLDLAAIGTVADMVPLLGPNRTIVKTGIAELRRTQRIGILALLKEAGLHPEEIDTYRLNFLIAPRLNAMGRLEHATDALRLLCTGNQERAERLAEKIGTINKKRQQLLEETLVQARTVYDQGKPSAKDRVIIIDHQDFHEGIIGLIAGKMVEEFYKPTIVLSRGRRLSKASARSIPGFNIIKRIRELEDLLVDVGGHPMAAGFTIETRHIHTFRQRMYNIAVKHIHEKLLEKSIKIDCELVFSDITDKLYQRIQEFEPFGMANPIPVFATKAALVQSMRRVGTTGQHLKLVIGTEEPAFTNPTLQAIGFGMGDRAEDITAGTKLDIAYSLELNVWSGRSNIELKLKDMKSSGTKESKQNNSAS